MPPKKNSRYSLCKARQDKNGRYFLTDPVPFRYKDLADNITHQAKAGDTWWGIAEMYYGEDGWKFWKFVFDFQIDPPSDPTVVLEGGSEVIIPSRNTIQQGILNTNRRVHY